MSIEDMPLRNRVAFTVSAAILSITASLQGSGDTPVAHTDALSVAVPDLSPRGLYGSSAPTDEAIKTVNKLLDEPGDSLYQAQPTYDEYSADKVQQGKFVTAARLGIDIVDTTPITNILEKDIYSSQTSKIPVQTYLEIGNNVLQPFDFKIALGKSGDPHYYYGAKEPKRNATDERDTKQAVISILEGFDDLPVPLVAKSDLEQVVLYKGTQESKVAAYATSDDHGRLIYGDITRALSGNVYDHEFTHTLDGAEQTLGYDPYFDALNNKKNVYSGVTFDLKRPNYATYANDTTSPLRTAIENGNHAEYCRLLDHAKKLGATVRFYSTYHPNSDEDKAEIGKEILSPSSYKSLLDPNLPIIDAKARTLLARMYDFDQPSARYLIATSTRVTSQKPMISCPKD